MTRIAFFSNPSKGRRVSGSDQPPPTRPADNSDAHHKMRNPCGHNPVQPGSLATARKSMEKPLPNYILELDDTIYPVPPSTVE
jgi:hypothetical protein